VVPTSGKHWSEDFRILAKVEHAGFLICGCAVTQLAHTVNGYPVAALPHRDDGLIVCPFGRE